MNKSPKSSSSNQSSEKLLTLMEYLSTADHAMRLSDLSVALDMNVSTLSRFLTTLMERGYVTQSPESSRYRISYKICQLSHNITSRMDLRRICLPYLQKVSKVFDCTANLIVQYNDSCIYLDMISAPQQLLMPLQRIGHVAPLYCTGAGKLLLMNMTDEELTEYAKDVSFEQFTEHTATSLGELKARIDLARELGYAIDDEECEYGARCIAVPVRDYTGNIIAAISITASVSYMTDSYITQNAPLLMSMISSLSRELGYEA